MIKLRPSWVVFSFGNGLWVFVQQKGQYVLPLFSTLWNICQQPNKILSSALQPTSFLTCTLCATWWRMKIPHPHFLMLLLYIIQKPERGWGVEKISHNRTPPTPPISLLHCQQLHPHQPPPPPQNPTSLKPRHPSPPASCSHWKWMVMVEVERGVLKWYRRIYFRNPNG